MAASRGVRRNRDAVLVALDAVDAGLVFADALHMSASAHASAVATFDQRLAKRLRNAAVDSRLRGNDGYVEPGRAS